MDVDEVVEAAELNGLDEDSVELEDGLTLEDEEIEVEEVVVLDAELLQSGQAPDISVSLVVVMNVRKPCPIVFGSISAQSRSLTRVTAAYISQLCPG